MLNIVIPMAGAGSRFAKQGYRDPKPMIPIHGTPMIKVVIDNLRPSMPHRFIFICQKSHLSEYGLQQKLSDWAPGCAIVSIDGLTEGASCTVLCAKALINSPEPLMIANSDQYIDCSIDQYLEKMDSEDLDALIMTMKADDPKWSFVGFDTEGRVEKVVEKRVVSDEATVGIYNFRSGSDFVNLAEEMIADDERVNGEFYVAPVYNRLIVKGKNIGVANIGSVGFGMYGLGTPDDLDAFLKLSLSKKAARGS